MTLVGESSMNRPDRLFGDPLLLGKREPRMRRITVFIAISAAMAVSIQAVGPYAVADEDSLSSPDPTSTQVISDIAQALKTKVNTAAVAAHVPQNGADTAVVRFSTGTLAMDLPATGNDLASADDATAVFAGTAWKTTGAVQGTDEGIRALVHIDSPDSPERFNFPIGGDAVELRPTRDGGIVAGPSWFFWAKCTAALALFAAQNLTPAKVARAGKIIKSAARFVRYLRRFKSTKSATKALAAFLGSASGVSDVVQRCWP